MADRRLIVSHTRENRGRFATAQPAQHRFGLVPRKQIVEHRVQLWMDAPFWRRNQHGNAVGNHAAWALTAHKTLFAPTAVAPVFWRLVCAARTHQTIAVIKASDDARLAASRTNRRIGSQANVTRTTDGLLVEKHCCGSHLATTETGMCRARRTTSAEHSLGRSRDPPVQLPARHTDREVTLVFGVAGTAHQHSVEPVVAETVLVASPTGSGESLAPTGTAHSTAILKRMLDRTRSCAALTDRQLNTSGPGDE